MFYQNASVSVDLTFARFGAKSYSINKINSVEVRSRQPHGQGLPVLFGLVAFGCLMSILMDGISAGVVVGLLLFGALMYWAWQRHKIVEYSLYLMTSSQEAQALATRSEAEIMTLRDAIEEAMSRQHERVVHVRHELAVSPIESESEMKQARPAKIRQRLLSAQTGQG